MFANLKLLDVVALSKDLPEKNLLTGQVGTIVEMLSENVFEVEFIDNSGKTYATTPINAKDVIQLHYEPVNA